MTPIVIVGCGPAGLSAASVIRRLHPSQEIILIDAGSPLHARDRSAPSDLIAGVGGAGLFSDGKFSFYPAASALWRLDPSRLTRAYDWLRALLSEISIDAPPLPPLANHSIIPAPSSPDLIGGSIGLPHYRLSFSDGPSPTTARVTEKDAMTKELSGAPGFKPYPSLYVSQEARYQLIEGLFSPFSSQALLHTQLLNLSRDADGFCLEVETNNQRRSLRASSVLLAGGRFSPLWLSTLRAELPMRFVRYELGLRLEGPVAHPFFSSLRSCGASVDPKLIMTDSTRSLEWRTFCFCQDGEIVAAQHENLWALSGRADGPRTGRSNVGFNVRFTARDNSVILRQATARPGDPSGSLPELEGFSLDKLRGVSPFSLSMQEFIEGDQLDAIYGKILVAALREGFLRLSERFPSLRSSALTLHGPVIEGVGEYPIFDQNLSISPGLYVAGDASGSFRGLVAAMISGAYAGEVLSSL